MAFAHRAPSRSSSRSAPAPVPEASRTVHTLVQNQQLTKLRDEQLHLQSEQQKLLAGHNSLAQAQILLQRKLEELDKKFDVGSSGRSGGFWSLFSPSCTRAPEVEAPSSSKPQEGTCVTASEGPFLFVKAADGAGRFVLHPLKNKDEVEEILRGVQEFETYMVFDETGALGNGKFEKGWDQVLHFSMLRRLYYDFTYQQVQHENRFQELQTQLEANQRSLKTLRDDMAMLKSALLRTGNENQQDLEDTPARPFQSQSPALEQPRAFPERQVVGTELEDRLREVAAKLVKEELAPFNFAEYDDLLGDLREGVSLLLNFKESAEGQLGGLREAVQRCQSDPFVGQVRPDPARLSLLGDDVNDLRRVQREHQSKLEAREDLDRQLRLELASFKATMDSLAEARDREYSKLSSELQELKKELTSKPDHALREEDFEKLLAKVRPTLDDLKKKQSDQKNRLAIIGDISNGVDAKLKELRSELEKLKDERSPMLLAAEIATAAAAAPADTAASTTDFAMTQVTGEPVVSPAYPRNDFPAQPPEPQPQSEPAPASHFEIRESAEERKPFAAAEPEAKVPDLPTSALPEVQTESHQGPVHSPGAGESLTSDMQRLPFELLTKLSPSASRPIPPLLPMSAAQEQTLKAEEQKRVEESTPRTSLIASQGIADLEREAAYFANKKILPIDATARNICLGIIKEIKEMIAKGKTQKELTDFMKRAHPDKLQRVHEGLDDASAAAVFNFAQDESVKGWASETLRLAELRSRAAC